MGGGETWGEILRPQALDLILLCAFIALAIRFAALISTSWRCP